MCEQARSVKQSKFICGSKALGGSDHQLVPLVRVEYLSLSTGSQVGCLATYNGNKEKQLNVQSGHVNLMRQLKSYKGEHCS